MRRKTSLTHDKLVEETRFILRNVQRTDVFGDDVEVAEAARVLEPSASLPFSDYVAFLTKYGYLRLEHEGRSMVVTSGGLEAAESDDAEFRARIARHFARELTAAAGQPRSEPSVLPTPLTMDSGLTAVVRSRRPLGMDRVPDDEVLDRRYRRGRLIGRSSTGAVHRGTHVTLKRPIALKEAITVFQFASYLRRDEIVDRLRGAIEAHAGLSHPHILQILDQNIEREHPYFVLELAEGGNLRQRLAAAEDGQLDLPVAIRVLIQTAYALGHAHARGVLHLGLKPENVLFDGLGNVKLSDFGLTRVLEQPAAAGPAPVLVGGNAVGYFAPERLQPGPVDELGPSADIYGLGILFYEMLTGRLPGRRSPLPSKAREGIPEAFDEVFDRMTHDALDERYATIEEVLEGLYQAFEPEVVFQRGTMLAWAADPSPPPAPEEESVEEVAVDEFEGFEADEKTPVPEPEPMLTRSGLPSSSSRIRPSSLSLDQPSGMPIDRSSDLPVDRPSSSPSTQPSAQPSPSTQDLALASRAQRRGPPPPPPPPPSSED